MLLPGVQTTSTELLDIVDETDNVIGSATRGDIHLRGLVHRSIHVLVFDGAEKILLQKRSMQKDQCAGMWDTSCAGHVEAGQGYEETAPRELDEELGFTPDAPLQALFKMQPTSANGNEFAMVYSVVHKGPFTAAQDEIDELRWFSFAEIDEWVDRLASSTGGRSPDLTSGFMEIWSRFREAPV